MRHVTLCTFGVVLFCGICAWAEDEAPVLKYGDGQADGKQSLGGSGEMIEFVSPSNNKVTGLRVHGSRYGQPQAPDESFLIYFLNADRTRIIHTEMAPYSLFERGPEAWVAISFLKPVELPEHYWVALDFRANQRKGVYLSYDTSALFQLNFRVRAVRF